MIKVQYIQPVSTITITLHFNMIINKHIPLAYTKEVVIKLSQPFLLLLPWGYLNMWSIIIFIS
jgi:hypothetical protein